MNRILKPVISDMTIFKLFIDEAELKAHFWKVVSLSSL
jgi:hypothetical protein